MKRCSGIFLIFLCIAVILATGCTGKSTTTSVPVTPVVTVQTESLSIHVDDAVVNNGRMVVSMTVTNLGSTSLTGGAILVSAEDSKGYKLEDGIATFNTNLQTGDKTRVSATIYGADKGSTYTIYSAGVKTAHLGLTRVYFKII